MERIQKYRPHKVLISLDEYMAIQKGLSEIECTIGSGYLNEEELTMYQKDAECLKKLIVRIISRFLNP